MIRVVLADDHAVLRDGLERLVQTCTDMRVVATAGDGLEAIAKAAEMQPGIVVMDISMPEMGGIEATRALLSRAPAIGVIMLSMHSARDTIAMALDAGARGYLLKDSAGAEVVTAIRAVAAGGVYLGQGVPVDALEAQCPGGPVRTAMGELTFNERRILRLIADGKSNIETARILGLSPRTVETYRGRLMEKLQLEDLPALVKFAVRTGMTSVE